MYVNKIVSHLKIHGKVDLGVPESQNTGSHRYSIINLKYIMLPN